MQIYCSSILFCFTYLYKMYRRHFWDPYRENPPEQSLNKPYNNPQYINKHESDREAKRLEIEINREQYAIVFVHEELSTLSTVLKSSPPRRWLARDLCSCKNTNLRQTSTPGWLACVIVWYTRPSFRLGILTYHTFWSVFFSSYAFLKIDVRLTLCISEL